MEIVFGIGIILVVGYFFGLVAEKFRLPRVTAYLISGVLFSEELLGHLLNLHFGSWSELLVEICLGLIAFIAGAKIKFSQIKQNRKIVLWGTLFSSILPMILVFTGFYFLSKYLGFSSNFAIVLASVASTTAPAATVAVIEQYNAKGKFTETLLEIVTFDDAVGVVLFAIVTSYYFGDSISSGLLIVAKELLWSISIGTIFGLSISKFAHLSKTNDYLFPLLIGIVFIIEGLSINLHFSPLLACIILGAVSVNTFKVSREVTLLLPIQHIEELVFITLFTMAGTHFSMIYFQSAIPYILMYVILRALGKYIGAYIGTKMIQNVGTIIPKWIGFALLPQAGVAIGLVFQACRMEGVTTIRPMLINIILGSTIIYEILGPLCSKYALAKAGELSDPNPL